jgi:EF-hand domain pair
MLLAFGAASCAVDALKSLTSSKPAPGVSQGANNPFDLPGGASAPGNSPPAFGPGGRSQLSPDTFSTLLAAQSQSSTGTTTPPSTSRSDALKDLFSQLDANGDGQIGKSEFENALGAGGTNLANADDVFGKLDKDGNGTVSLDELSSALKGAGKGHHRHHAASSDGSGGSDGSSSDPLLQALSGASSTQVSNSDGSTTTSVTYADGSKVTLTSPSATTSSSSATSSYNFIERLIQREAQAISSSATASLSV